VAVRWVDLDQGDVTEHGSRGLHMVEAARLAVAGEFRVHVAQVRPGGLLGRHPTRLWQLFRVVHGEGWVSGEDGQRHPLRAGQAVLWHPGEHHESGSDTGMTVVIVQADVPLPHGG
jgi:quercetin dioxygenase-like cupin family protein